MMSEIEKFEKKIKDYKDELFGVKLLYEGTKILWADSDVIGTVLLTI